MAQAKTGAKLSKKATPKEDEKVTVAEDVEVSTEDTEAEVSENDTEVAENEAEDTATVVVDKASVKATAPAPKKSGIVKVTLSKDHRCTIGGVTWDFKKGEVYDVPTNVKSVLRRGDLLRPVN